MSVMLKYVRFLKLIPDGLKTQEMRNEAVEKAPWLLYDVPVPFRTLGMCSTAVEKFLHPLRFIPDNLET